MIAVASAVTAFHAYSFAYPSALNWGVHHLAFLPGIASAVILVLMVLFLIPRVQSDALRYLEQGLAWFDGRSRRMKGLLKIAAIGTLILLFWFAKEEGLMLGDGELVSQVLPMLSDPSAIASTNFVNEPLSVLAYYSAFRFLPMLGFAVQPVTAYQIVSILFGVASVVALWSIAKVIGHKSIDRALIYGVLLFGGGSQLFFGYVEDYAPLYFGVILYLSMSLVYLEGKTSLTIVGVIYSVLFLLHFGTLILVPSLALLFYHSIRHRRYYQVVQSALMMMVVISVGLWLCGYSVNGFIRQFAQASNVSFTHPDPMVRAYGFFSMFHFVDIANLALLLSPFALPSAAAALLFCFDRHAVRGYNSVFLLTAGVCGLAFFAGINSLLGMSRDWDLFASYGIPVAVAGMYFWNRLVEDPKVRRKLLLMMAAITLLHSIPWITLNVHDAASFKRFGILEDERLWSKKALINGYEEDALRYRARNDTRATLESYLKILAIDSLNPRLVKNVGVAYGKLGDTLKKMEYFRREIDQGGMYEDVFIELANYYISRKNFAGAYEYARQGLAANPNSSRLENAMGIVLYSQHANASEALPYFVRAAALDPTMIEALINAAQGYYYLGDTVRVKQYARRALEIVPNDPRALKFLERVHGK